MLPVLVKLAEKQDARAKKHKELVREDSLEFQLEFDTNAQDEPGVHDYEGENSSTPECYQRDLVYEASLYEHPKMYNAYVPWGKSGLCVLTPGS